MVAPRTETQAIDDLAIELARTTAAIAALAAAVQVSCLDLATKLAPLTAAAQAEGANHKIPEGLAVLAHDTKELVAATKVAGDMQARACHLMGYQVTLAALLEREASLGFINDEAVARIRPVANLVALEAAALFDRQTTP